MAYVKNPRFRLAAAILALAFVSSWILTPAAPAAPNTGIEDLLEEFPLESTPPAPVDAPPAEPTPAEPAPAPAGDDGGSSIVLALAVAGLGLAGVGGVVAVAVARTRRRSRLAAAGTSPAPAESAPRAEAPMPAVVVATPVPVAPPSTDALLRPAPASRDAIRPASAGRERPAANAPAPAVAAPAVIARAVPSAPPAAPAAAHARGNPFDAHVRPTGPPPVAAPSPPTPTTPEPTPAPALGRAPLEAGHADQGARPTPAGPFDVHIRTASPDEAPASDRGTPDPPARRSTDLVPDLVTNGAGAAPAVTVIEQNGAGAHPVMTPDAILARVPLGGARAATPYDAAGCARFAAGLGDEVLDRAILLFSALARHGRIGSFRLAERLGAGPGDLAGLILTPLKRRADALNLGAPFVTDTTPGSRARVWRDAAGLAGRMERALRAEELARAEEATREPLERYRPLTATLRRLEGDQVAWTLREIEAMIGAELPPDARTCRRWWANRADADTHVQARAWLDAGMLALPALREDRVTFRRPAIGKARPRAR